MQFLPFAWLSSRSLWNIECESSCALDSLTTSSFQSQERITNRWFNLLIAIATKCQMQWINRNLNKRNPEYFHLIKINSFFHLCIGKTMTLNWIEVHFHFPFYWKRFESFNIIMNLWIQIVWFLGVPPFDINKICLSSNIQMILRRFVFSSQMKY